MEGSEIPAVTVNNSVKVCSIFNVKEYNEIISLDDSSSNCKSDIRLSKLMKLNVNVTLPSLPVVDESCGITAVNKNAEDGKY